MEKTKQLLESVAENYAVAAENICKYIEDPDEKKEQLNDLRKLTMEHAKLAHEFDLQEKAVLHVTSQLKEIKDLEIEKQYEEMVRRYTDGYRKSDEDFLESTNCTELEQVITRCLKTTVKEE